MRHGRSPRSNRVRPRAPVVVSPVYLDELQERRTRFVPETEDEWIERAVKAARDKGWSVDFLIGPSMPGWVYLGIRRVLFVELVIGRLDWTLRRRMRELQRAGLEAYVWRPADEPMMTRILGSTS